MRARVVIGLDCLGVGCLGLGCLVVAACVPDFAYDGLGGGRADGDGGDRPSRGGGGGSGPGILAVGVGPGGGGPSAGPGPGPGPGPTTSSTGEATTGVTGAGGQGDGGAASTTTTSTTGGDAATSSSTGGTLVDDGAPCWDGSSQQVVSCTGSEVCCYDEDYYSYHECDTAGFCGDYAYELQCNDAGDCDPGELCCVNVDSFGDLRSITCETSCPDLHACSAQQPCPGNLTCYYVFDPDSSHDEYDAYGFCYEG